MPLGRSTIWLCTENFTTFFIFGKPFISFIGTHNKLPYLKDFCHEDAVFSLCLAMSNFTKKWDENIYVYPELYFTFSYGTFSGLSKFTL